MYKDELIKVWFRPILFFTRLPAGAWTEGSVNFVGITAWILALAVTLVIFITQYVPIGNTLWEGVPVAKLILVVPVMALLAGMFFLVTITILGGVFMAGLLGLFYVLGAILYWSSRLLGGQGEYPQMLKASNYSSAVMLIFVLPILMMILTKRGILDFTNFRIGFNMTCSFAVLYLYGLQAIINRKLTGLSRPWAFASALLAALAMVILALGINFVILPKIAPWIM
jgi:hypothetical protein